MALAICVDGTKVPVGLWLGDTENKTIVTARLADLVDRGLTADDGLLVVIDGAKALAAAVRKVFGTAALIQRCTLHKRRNVRDHLPKDQRAWVDRKLAAAFANENTTNSERAARDLARANSRPAGPTRLRVCAKAWRRCSRSGASGSPGGSPRRSNTNCIESMISIARDTTHNVKRWRDAKMIKRWCAAGMLNAEQSFRRLKSHKQMPALVAALARHVETVTPTCDTAKVA